MVGNIIEQSATTDNSTIISFGAEGYASPVNALYLASNTIVDDRPNPGIVLQVKPGAQQVQAVNNLVVGLGKLEGGQRKGWRDRVKDIAKAAYYQDKTLLWPESGIKGNFVNNFNVDWTAFALPMRYDYRLTPAAALDGKFVLPGDVNGISLAPKSEYVHPASARPLKSRPLVPGALQTMASDARLN